MTKPYIIGVTGGSGSGKTFFLKELLKRFSENEICLVSQDNYYRDRDQQPVDDKGVKNFDLPQSIDELQMIRDIEDLKSGKEVHISEYTFNNPAAKSRNLVFKPAPVIIVEGLMVFYWQQIRSLMDLRVFIEAEDLIKVKRRIIRDARERGYDLEDVLYRYQYHVDPFYKMNVEPLKKEMDLIIPNNIGFEGGLNVLEGYIRNLLIRK
ncbi:MAG: uridine kinase [Cyclobacteriaceae bacterium]|nr:uridine kinase [Cyclobacteriaceae bacterium]